KFALGAILGCSARSMEPTRPTQRLTIAFAYDPSRHEPVTPSPPCSNDSLRRQRCPFAGVVRIPVMCPTRRGESVLAKTIGPVPGGEGEPAGGECCDPHHARPFAAIRGVASSADDREAGSAHSWAPTGLRVVWALKTPRTRTPADSRGRARADRDHGDRE